MGNVTNESNPIGLGSVILGFTHELSKGTLNILIGNYPTLVNLLHQNTKFSTVNKGNHWLFQQGL
jgi:hypothetical protein